MKYISDITTTKPPWLLLAISAFVLELSALFFQYGLGLAPCIMCIYQRVALWAIFFSGVIGCSYSHIVAGRVFGYLLWGIGAIWGLFIAIEHHDIQTSPMSFLYSCEFVPNFPSWLPLHELIPFLFEATGDCGDIDWQFVGFTMPQVMIVVYGVYSALLAVTLINRLFHHKRL